MEFVHNGILLILLIVADARGHFQVFVAPVREQKDILPEVWAVPIENLWLGMSY